MWRSEMTQREQQEATMNVIFHLSSRTIRLFCPKRAEIHHRVNKRRILKSHVLEKSQEGCGVYVWVAENAAVLSVKNNGIDVLKNALNLDFSLADDACELRAAAWEQIFRPTATAEVAPAQQLLWF